MARTRSSQNKHTRKKKQSAHALKLNRERVQKFRAALRKDKQRYEEAKAKDREKKEQARLNGKIKSVADMTQREQRVFRRRRKEYMRQYRARKKAADISNSNESPVSAGASSELPASPSNMPSAYCEGSHMELSVAPKPKAHTSRQHVRGRKEVARRRTKLYRENQSLQEENMKLKRKVEKLQKRETRRLRKQRTPTLTPRRKLRRLSGGKFLQPGVKRQLFKGLVLEEEVTQGVKNMGKSLKAKRLTSKLLSGRVLKKYRVYGCFSYLPLKSLRNRQISVGNGEKNPDPLKFFRKTSVTSAEKKKAIQNFYLSDRASHFSPNKKSYVTVGGEQVQKRFLNDTLSSLFKIFLVESGTKCSFSTFCKQRPVHVVSPKMSGRDTCLCTKCENFKHLVKSLSSSNVIEECNAQNLMDSLCCSPPTEACRFRQCTACKAKTVEYAEHCEESAIKYFKWATRTVQRISAKTNQPIPVKVCEKTEVTCTVKEAKNEMEGALWERMAHGERIFHQFKEWKTLQENMTEEDLLVECDWSENWSTKCASEVQSTHFGGSHQQISLHTGYAQTTQTKETFCTISEITRHDPIVIYAHLIPIIKKYLTPKTKYLHIKTDGPTTQYRSKTMFFIVAQYISRDFPQLKQIFWNFSEAGHGKQISDGVGGTIKRVADSIVAHGTDIPNVEALIDVLSRKELKTFITCINKHAVDTAERKICVPRDLRPFSGTMKVHQYVWSATSPSNLTFKTLSCYRCLRQEPICSHFNFGRPYNIPLV